MFSENALLLIEDPVNGRQIIGEFKKTMELSGVHYLLIKLRQGLWQGSEHWFPMTETTGFTLIGEDQLDQAVEAAEAAQKQRQMTNNVKPLSRS